MLPRLEYGLTTPLLKLPFNEHQLQFFAAAYDFKHSTILYFFVSSMGNVDDQHRNPNMNNKDHLVAIKNL